MELHLMDSRPRRLSHYLNIYVEIFTLLFTILPILVLIYYYPSLPDRIPVFLEWRTGEVSVWAAKSFVSVFKVAAMGVDLQILCLLAKYGWLRSRSLVPHEQAEEFSRFEEESKAIRMRLLDWLRCLIALKWSEGSLMVIFLSFERLRFITPTYRVTSAISVLLAIGAACYYGYRFLRVRRKLEALAGDAAIERIDKRHLYAGFLYYNSYDPSVFVKWYGLNWAHKLSYLLVATGLTYPVLVFLPVLLG
jgi:uncharacterized membrane protein